MVPLPPRVHYWQYRRFVHEQWRPVRGYESAYECSDLGVVQSRERYVRGRENSRRKLQGKRLTPRVRPDGTLAVNLWHQNGYRQVPIRRIVLDAFDGPQPRGYDAVNKDGNPQNNNLGNLKWSPDKRLRSTSGLQAMIRQ